jgi:hypothetical protein
MEEEVVLAEEGFILLLLSWLTTDDLRLSVIAPPLFINGRAITERHKSSMVKINLPLHCRILLRHHFTLSLEFAFNTKRSTNKL